MKPFLLVFSLIWLSTPIMAAECDYHFTLNNATIQIADAPQVIQQTFSVQRGQNSPFGRCSPYRVFFAKGTSNSYQRTARTIGGASLNYNLHRNINTAGVLKDFADAVSASEFLDGQAPEKQTPYTNRFFISTPGLNNNVLLAGTYIDLVQVSIYGYNENSGNYLFDEAVSFTVVFYVPKKVQVSLIDEGQAFDVSSTSKTLDFGQMQQNQEKGADLRVLSNGNYQIKISSLNNGKMVQANQSVLYALRVNGTSVALTSSASSPVLIGSGNATSQAGDLYNLKVRIDENVANKSAGLYQDVITITAIAN